MMGGPMPGPLTSAYGAIPLSASGFAWVVPAALGGIAGGVLWKAAGPPNHDPRIPRASR